MSDYLPTLVGLIALLAGLATGKAWERYKLRDGRWIDRRKARQSPHYIIGLNYLVSNQIDLAIEELGQAAKVDPDALEIHLILGNLYREKGQVGRAINVHQSLLQRPRLTPLAHAHVLLCLGLDFRRGGFVDRAHEAFKEVLRLDATNRYALANLQKLHEEQHQWLEAYQLRQQLAALDDDEGQRSQSTPMILAAIDREAGTVPAYLNLGDLRERQGNIAQAAVTWERVPDVAPARAYLVFERLKRAYAAANAPERFADVCRRLIAANPQDWRARLALARHLAERNAPREALDLSFEALSQNPHSLLVHQSIWAMLAAVGSSPELIERYLALTRDSVFYLDPHVCTRCRYRSTELLWQCPQCHDWNTFIEERFATARDEEASG
jgi:lipopolysaccharide biosynthesis regulator YciM